jgi:uncharacterized protein (TIGR03118 family)
MKALSSISRWHAALALLLLLSLFPSAAFAQHYTEKDLVSNLSGVGHGATPVDADLVNAWGLTRSAGSPWWVSDNGTGKATVYDGTGLKQNLTVTVPGGSPHSAPTGVVANGTTSEFLGARFIFVTEDGTIAGFTGGTTVVTEKNNSTSGAVYKGCTIAEWNGKHYLYAANFHSGKIEVYDSTFTAVSLSKHAFDADDDDFDLGRGHSDFDHDRWGRHDFDEHHRHFAPFNVQAIGSNVFVSYAEQDDQKHDEVAGPGLGFVIVFSPSGERLARLQHGSWFDAPWGMAMAPSGFGEFSHSLLVGNFGSGQIAAFNPVNGKFIGLMKKPDDSILSIDGLWALAFGGSANSGPFNTLFFTAGPNGESNGIFGTLVSIAAEINEIDEP